MLEPLSFNIPIQQGSQINQSAPFRGVGLGHLPASDPISARARVSRVTRASSLRTKCAAQRRVGEELVCASGPIDLGGVDEFTSVTSTGWGNCVDYALITACAIWGERMASTSNCRQYMHGYQLLLNFLGYSFHACDEQHVCRDVMVKQQRSDWVPRAASGQSFVLTIWLAGIQSCPGALEQVFLPFGWQGNSAARVHLNGCSYHLAGRETALCGCT